MPKAISKWPFFFWFEAVVFTKVFQTFGAKTGSLDAPSASAVGPAWHEVSA